MVVADSNQAIAPLLPSTVAARLRAMTTIGTAYLVGGGPGAPGLITLRAVECLGRADLVLYDALIHRDLLKHCRPDATLEFVGKRAGDAAARQQTINKKLVGAALSGQCVVRLKGGDPYLFGRGSEEAECLSNADVPFEIVPGVPSPLAATAYAGISLSHRNKASSVAYITATEAPEKSGSAHDFSKLATATQTLVIFMGVRKLAGITAELIRHGRSPDCPAAVISRASLPQQQTVVGTVGTIAQMVKDEAISMPALTVIGEVVELRDVLRWYDNKPLFGKNVLVTRAQQQAHSFVTSLRQAGASAIEHPTICIQPPVDRVLAERAAREVGEYDWVLFTSVNGVDRFFELLQSQGMDSRRFGAARIAVIGPATRDRLKVHGIVADTMPTAYRGEALADAVLAHHDHHMHAQSVLIPRAEVAREILPDTLRRGGAKVDVVPMYRTVPMPAKDAQALVERLELGDVDVVTLTSSSTADNLVSALGARAPELLRHTTVASIGPITTATAEAHGIKVDITAEDYTLPGLVSALEAHFSEQV